MDVDYNLQLMRKESEANPESLCTLSLLLTKGGSSSDWVMQKVKLFRIVWEFLVKCLRSNSGHNMSLLRQADSYSQNLL